MHTFESVTCSTVLLGITFLLITGMFAYLKFKEYANSEFEKLDHNIEKKFSSLDTKINTIKNELNQNIQQLSIKNETISDALEGFYGELAKRN